MFATAVRWRRPVLASILVACTTTALAADVSPSSAVSASEVFAARQSAVKTARALQPAGARRQAVATSGGAVQPSEIYANPFRAYPPSCLSDGLPFRSFPQSQGDPAPQQKQMTLIGDLTQCVGGGNAQECNHTETVTVTVWRVACSNNQTAVLMEIDRTATNEQRAEYPTFPLVSITQNNLTLFPVRAVDDPNTLYANTFANSPLNFSDIFVLENYASNTTQQIDYTKAFTLDLDNNTIAFDFPDYDHTKYGAGIAPLPISGYLSTNWFDALHSGEGMLTQIYDGDSVQGTRFFTAAWYTFDPLGLPFWLYAQGTINIGDRAANNVAVFYATNGGFAGNFPAGNATFTQWGTANFSFPDCNTLTFSYNGHTDAQTNGPGGSGTRTWTRLANINSLVCN